MTETTTERKRALSIPVQQRRAAVEMLKPVLDDLAVVQQETALLVTIGERLRLRGQGDPTRAHEARRLVERIDAHRRWLAEQLRTCSDVVVKHGRVVDVLKALDTAAAGAQRANILLAGSAAGPSNAHDRPMS